MSRYDFPGHNPDHTVVAGWDNPLATFFAEIFDESLDEDDDTVDTLVLWLGTTPEAILTVATLQAQLAPWATIPPRIVQALTQDHQHATPPTALQRWARQVFASIEAPPPDPTAS